MSEIQSCSGPTGESFGFDAGIARHVGVGAAIMFGHITYWLRYNAQKGQNFIEGKTWMYESIPEMSEFLGFMTEKQIRTAITILVDNGYLIEGCHSKNKFDRTTWYSVPDNSWIKFKNKDTKRPTGRMDEAQEAHPKGVQGACIYNDQVNTIKTTTTKEEVVVVAPSIEDENRQMLLELRLDLAEVASILKHSPSKECLKNAIDCARLSNPDNLGGYINKAVQCNYKPPKATETSESKSTREKQELAKKIEERRLTAEKLQKQYKSAFVIRKERIDIVTEKGFHPIGFCDDEIEKYFDWLKEQK